MTTRSPVGAALDKIKKSAIDKNKNAYFDIIKKDVFDKIKNATFDQIQKKWCQQNHKMTLSIFFYGSTLVLNNNEHIDGRYFLKYSSPTSQSS